MVTTQIGGFASYVELLTCLEMAGGVTSAPGPSRWRSAGSRLGRSSPCWPWSRGRRLAIAPSAYCCS